MSELSLPTRQLLSTYRRVERPAIKQGLLDQWGKNLNSHRASCTPSRSDWQWAETIISQSQALEPITDADLDTNIKELKSTLIANSMNRESCDQAFILVREVARRTLGMAHYANQLLAGRAILNGELAELATGEGKTLVATLPCVTAALAGIPVHMVTSNDYLTARDAELMRPIYKFFGLSLGCVTSETEPDARRNAYRADVCYVTNNEVAFDYLKDRIDLGDSSHWLQRQAKRLSLGRSPALLQRGLHFAVVDEADSVLIDEARTPLLIAGQGELNQEEINSYRLALQYASQLQAGQAFELDKSHRRVELTAAGREQLSDWAAHQGGIWCGQIRREELVTLALSALHLHQRDSHYIVRDEKIQIVDEHTGRAMPDRTWSRGLHQLIECKEGVEPSAPTTTRARISFQSFFSKYCHLGGMTGTAREVSGEIYRVYGCKTRLIPVNRPCRRQQTGLRVAMTQQEKWQRVIQAIEQCHQRKQPVLVGVASVSACLELGKQLKAAGLPHQLLTAHQDAEEAEIVSRSGQAGAITIATSMAGRGTDIKLDDTARQVGGLHVILTELHEAARIDRQLIGRSARQGDPGSFEYCLACDDALIERFHQTGLMQALLRMGGDLAAFRLYRAQQNRLQRHYAKVRQQLITQDQQQQDLLAFAGREA